MVFGSKVPKKPKITVPLSLGTFQHPSLLVLDHDLVPTDPFLKTSENPQVLYLHLPSWSYLLPDTEGWGIRIS